MSLKDKRRAGIDPFSYMGVEAIAPLRLVTFDRAPLAGDYTTFDVGDFWIDRSTVPETLWMLAKKLSGVATWVEFADIDELALQFDGDTGSAVPTVLGVLNVPGTAILSSSGAGNTITYDIVNGANGQILISSGGAGVAWANITSAGGTIAITNGANTINLETTVPSGMDSILGDIGIANPVLGNIEILGDTNITTAGDGVSTITITLNDSIVVNEITLSSLGAGVVQTSAAGLFSSSNGTNGQVLIGGGASPAWANITSTGATVTITNGANTINLESAVAVGMDTFTGDSGTATPAADIIVVAGGTNITTVGDNASTITVNLNDSIDVSGTLTISALGVGVMQTNGAGLVTSNTGTNGQVVIGGTTPAWANLTSTGATITITNGANTINLESAGGGLGTNAFLAYQPSQYIVGSGVLYTLGEDVILTEVYDTGTDFYPGDGLGTAASYTAPADGKYFLAYNHIAHYTAPPPPNPIDPPVYQAIDTTNLIIANFADLVINAEHVAARYQSVLIDMDLGDTAIFKNLVTYLDVEVDGDATEVRTFVCGYRVS